MYVHDDIGQKSKQKSEESIKCVIIVTNEMLIDYLTKKELERKKKLCIT